MKKDEKIALIRKCVETSNYPLKYDWKAVYRKGNCYSYAIGSTYEEISVMGEEYIYNLGCISNQAPATSIQEAGRNFKEDMSVIGIQVRNSCLQESIVEDEWKVVLFYDDRFFDSYDFHFARQDDDGNWSHREWIDGPVRRLGSNPEGCTDLTLVSYYILQVK